MKSDSRGKSEEIDFDYIAQKLSEEFPFHFNVNFPLSVLKCPNATNCIKLKTSAFVCVSVCVCVQFLPLLLMPPCVNHML